MKKRSIVIDGHATSIALEDEFWQALRHIAGVKGLSAAQLIAAIDRQRSGPNLSSAIRVFVLANAALLKAPAEPDH